MSIPYCSLLKSGCKTLCCRDRIKIVISTLTGSSLCGWFCWRWACSLLLSVPSQPLWVSCQIASCWLPLQVLKVDRSHAIFQGGSVAWLRFGLIYVGCPDLKDGETPLNLTIERWLPKVFLSDRRPSLFQNWSSYVILWVRFSQESSVQIHTLAFVLFPDISNTWSSRKKEMGHVTCACFFLVCL